MMKKIIGTFALTILLLGDAEAQSLFPAANFSGIDITNGLQIELLFHGNSNDSSGNGRAATAVGSPSYTTGQDGIASHAISLNGSSQYLVSEYAPLDWIRSYAPTAGTCCQWVYAVSEPGGGSFTIYEQGPPNNNFLIAFPYGTPILLAANVGSATAFFGNTVISLNAWHFIGVTYDGTIGKFYVDGKFDGSFAQAGPPNKTGGAGTQIGRYYTNAGGGTGFYFNGYMQDFRIYNRALSAAEMNQLFQNGAR